MIEQIGRKQWSACVEDVFSAGRWLASAPLHEAGKTTKSGNTLKPGIRREELGFASDNPSSDPNAYPLISTFSKPHSEVTSTTHLPELKGGSEKALRCFLVWLKTEGPPANAAFKNAAREGTSSTKDNLSPVRCENVLHQTNGFRTLYSQGRLPRKYRFHVIIVPWIFCQAV